MTGCNVDVKEGRVYVPSAVGAHEMVLHPVVDDVPGEYCFVSWSETPGRRHIQSSVRTKYLRTRVRLEFDRGHQLKID